ncbi:Glutamate receptor 4 [Frankliniella fusca]|uniref:Glutamate receptor 4 n=1 Tax=Frankliniella fusca TaxID=407009 RepID=A0AAE1LKG7_9NEOP|nr:Glutamate receptor 4 [Frankliniella fusca]
MRQNDDSERHQVPLRSVAAVLTVLAALTAAGYGCSALRPPTGQTDADSLPSGVEIFSNAARQAFGPQHRCVAVLLTDHLRDAPVSALLQELWLPVVVLGPQGYRRPSDWLCSALLVLAAGNPNEALASLAGRANCAVLVVLLEDPVEDPTEDGADIGNVPQVAEPAQQAFFCGASSVSLASGRRWLLSEAYLAPPRTWRRVQDGDSVWGAAAAAARRVDLQGRTLRVATFHQPPLMYIDNPDDPAGVSGTEWAVLRLLAQHLNFSLSLVKLPDGDPWGHPDGEGSWRGGTLGALVSGRADLVPGVWFQLDQARVADFAHSTRLSCMTFMAPRPRFLFASGNAVFRPLQPAVWMYWGLAISAAAVSGRALHAATRRVFAAVSHGHLLQREPRPWRGRGRPGPGPHALLEIPPPPPPAPAPLPPPAEHFSSLSRGLLVLLGGAVTTYIPRSSASLGPHRHLVAWWVVFAMLMTTAYSSGLMTQLTLRRTEAAVDSAADIVRHGLTWASTFAPNVNVLLNLENEAERLLAAGLRLVEPAHWEAAVASGRHVVQGQRLGRAYFYWPGGDLSTATLRRLRVMRSCLARYPTAVALARGSPLRGPFDATLLRLVQAGLVARWQNLVLSTRGRPPVFALLADEVRTDGPQPLQLVQLRGAFRALGAGLALAGLVFVVELISRGRGRRPPVPTPVLHAGDDYARGYGLRGGYTT